MSRDRPDWLNHYSRSGLQVFLGSINITASVVDGSFTHALNLQSTAKFQIDTSMMPSTAVDLAAELTVRSAIGGTIRFTGEITSAHFKGSVLMVEVRNGLILSDSAVTGNVMWNIPPMESLYTLVRTGGLQDDKIQIEGLDRPVVEYFEVVFPVSNVRVSRRRRLGGALLLSRSELASTIESLMGSAQAGRDVAERFLAFDAYLLVGVTAQLAIDAEDKGWAEARSIIAWLCVDARSSTISGPGSPVVRYERQQTRTVPELAAICYLRAAVTRRTWIRDMSLLQRYGDLNADLEPRAWPVTSLGALDTSLTNAAQSLYRAMASSQDSAAANLAIWDAVEFYCSRVQSDRQFSKAEARALWRAVQKAGRWDKAQQDRLANVRQMLDVRPLLWKLRTQLANDDVGFVNEEFEALARLRSARNDLVHGRNMTASEDNDLRTGIRVLARALTCAGRRPRVPDGYDWSKSI